MNENRFLEKTLIEMITRRYIWAFDEAYLVTGDEDKAYQVAAVIAMIHFVLDGQNNNKRFTTMCSSFSEFVQNVFEDEPHE